jgi:hypothetical protein
MGMEVAFVLTFYVQSKGEVTMKAFLAMIIFSSVSIAHAGTELIPCNPTMWKLLGEAVLDFKAADSQTASLRDDVASAMTEEMGPKCEVVFSTEIGATTMESNDYQFVLTQGPRRYQILVVSRYLNGPSTISIKSN